MPVWRGKPQSEPVPRDRANISPLAFRTRCSALHPSRRACPRPSRPAPATGLPEPPATGAAPNAPSPRTRTLFPSLPAVVRTSPAAGPLPCSPCRTAPSLERCPQGPPSPQLRHPVQRPGSPPRRFRQLRPSRHPVPQDEPTFPAFRQLPDAHLAFQSGHAGALPQGRLHGGGLRPRHTIAGRESPASCTRFRGRTAKQIFQPFRPESRLFQKIGTAVARRRFRRRPPARARPDTGPAAGPSSRA